MLCVRSLHVEMRTSEAASERAVLSRLHMVDLAGSERTKKTNASGQVGSSGSCRGRQRPGGGCCCSTSGSNVGERAMEGVCSPFHTNLCWPLLPRHINSFLLPVQTLKEAQFINKSLSFLEQTVGALARKEAHVPFRTSRLTSVLRDALGGNCKVCACTACW